MIHKNTIIAAVLVSAALMLTWSYIADRGYEKIKPRLEEKQKQIEAKRQEFKERLKENIQDLGGDPSMLDKTAILETTEILKQTVSSARPFRPMGTWMGTCKGTDIKVAVARFEKDKYWLLFKDPVAGDYAEKGNYDFHYDSLQFKPQGKSPYQADYEQISAQSIALHMTSATLLMEKTENIQLDF